MRIFLIVMLASLAGCAQLQKPDDGTLDMDKFERIVKTAEDSGATVELDVSLRPGSAGIANSIQWDTGIEVTGRFRWTGKGPQPQ